MKKLKIIAFLIALTSGLGFTDVDLSAEITEKFNAYNKIFPHTKLHLSFNQPAYAAGDTAFFKAHLLSDNLIPISGRQIMNLAIIDVDGQVQMRKTYRIDDGQAVNQTVIPNDLAPGIYRLVAYTNWMKNFSSELYFNAPLHISGENYFEYPPDAPVRIELFPEGGSFIAGLSSKVVAVATRNGIPIEAGGRVADDNGKEIVRFNCDKTGLASFDFLPNDQSTYTFESISSGQKFPISIEPEGFSLSVNVVDELIKANIGFQSKRGKNESIYVILTSRSQVKYASMITAKRNESNSVVIPTKNIPEGIAQITLFDDKARVMATRLVFIPSQDTARVNLRLSDQSMATRSAATFEIDVKDQYGASKGADVFVSSYYSNLFPGIGTSNFREDLLVGTDIPGSQFFLQRIDINSGEGMAALDNFLITKEWKRYNWDEVLSNKKLIPEYRAEGTLIYDGVATFTDSGKPVSDSTLVLLFLQKRTFGYEVYTTNDGVLRWPVYFDFYGDENIMYSMESKNKRLLNTNIRLLKDSLMGFDAPALISSSQKDPYYSFSILSNAVNSSFSYGWNKADVVSNSNNPNAVIEDELNGVDVTINLEDYVVFPTIEDLFREVVRYVQNRKVGGKKTLRVLSSDSNHPIMGDPLYIVDGIATRNTDFIFSLNPADIAIIKVINDAKKLRNLGSITKNGVIFFQTKISDIRTIIPKDDILVVDGLVKPVNFETKINVKSAKTPHLKSSVYWKTQLERNERGLIADTFNSADNTGTLNVRVQGITIDGIPFDKTQTVEVKFQQPN